MAIGGQLQSVTRGRVRSVAVRCGEGRHLSTVDCVVNQTDGLLIPVLALLIRRLDSATSTAHVWLLADQLARAFQLRDFTVAPYRKRSVEKSRAVVTCQV